MAIRILAVALEICIFDNSKCYRHLNLSLSNSAEARVACENIDEKLAYFESN